MSYCHLRMLVSGSHEDQDFSSRISGKSYKKTAEDGLAHMQFARADNGNGMLVCGKGEGKNEECKRILFSSN